MYLQLLNLMMRAENAAAPAEQSAEMGTVSIVPSIIMLALMFALMYFMIIRPQKKKEKEAQEMRDSLQIGDEVTTIGGIVGIVVRKNEDTKTVVIETGGDRSKIRVKMWAISENSTVHDAQDELGKKK